GVVPLLTASGAGSASQQALGTVVFGGMLASTLLAIPFVPVFFILVRRIADRPAALPATAARPPGRGEPRTAAGTPRPVEPTAVPCYARDMRTLDELSRGELATLGREYMLFGHLLNRAALPHVHFQVGAEAREAVAIEEWMGASPIYTRRMQARMGFTGSGVGTIFKGFQLDVGFPHQYMDVHYDLESEERGTFWLVSCGALLEVEQYGEAAVRSMCHAIEDPTFDASAVATNPLARCRPI